jgi:hypothetical protein
MGADRRERPHAPPRARVCRREEAGLTSLGWILGLQSLHPKIPFPATEFRTATDQLALGNWVCREAGFEQLRNLLRIQSEGFELSAPFRGRVAEPFDTDAAGQAARLKSSSNELKRHLRQT